VRIANEYTYSLIQEGSWQVVLGKFPSNHQAHADADAVIIILPIRNVGAGPIRLRVEEFRIVLNGRTNDDSDQTLELILPRVAPKGIRSGTIRRDAGQKTLTGTGVCKILYGGVDGPLVRRFTLRARLNLQIAEKDVLLMDEIQEEKDEPYNAA